MKQLNFVSSMRSTFTLKKSFLKEPDFDSDVLEAVENTRVDGEIRLCGNIAERFIVEPSSTNGKVRILMITGFQAFEEELNE